MSKELENKTIKGIQLANKFGWGLSNFKRFVSQFLKYKNNEDDWTYDYEVYCMQLTGINVDKLHRYVHPLNWAANYYQDNWDLEELEKAIKNLK